ncbi:MAG TPA: MBL fold metallo-hydrolase, partial [Coriobacteriia bacterium]|nr:MBL fold metallo-hydrolase [Coriobacteriia bacterium]
MLEFGEVSFLFAGEAKTSLVSAACDKTVDVLKVAHHGSSVGTNAALVSKLKPSYAVISCGADNSYGHPHKEVLDAFS